MDLSTKLKITAMIAAVLGGAVGLAGPGLKGDPSPRADRTRSVRRAVTRISSSVRKGPTGALAVTASARWRARRLRRGSPWRTFAVTCA
jgi:hypothetical protein